MIKHQLYGILLLSATLYLGVPSPATAGHHTHRRYDVHHGGHQSHPHEPQRSSHRHRRPSQTGFEVSISIGSHGGYGGLDRYRHGHPRHRHGPYCPVGLGKLVDPHVRPYPVWHVYHTSHSTPGHRSHLRLLTSVADGEVYVNDQYLGQTNTFHYRGVYLPVAPGRHTVRLRIDDTTYTQQVQVEHGSTTVVEARLPR